MGDKWKYVGGWLSTLSVVLGFAALFYYFAGWELRLWDTPQQKWEKMQTIDRVNHSIDNFDSLVNTQRRNAEHAMRSRAHRDSVMDEQGRINHLNAVQIEKLIKKQDSIYSWWVKYNESVKNEN